MYIFYKRCGPEQDTTTYYIKNSIVSIPPQNKTAPFLMSSQDTLYIETKIQNLGSSRRKNQKCAPFDVFYFQFSKPIFSDYILVLRQFLVPDITKKIILAIINIQIGTYKDNDFVLQRELPISVRLNYYLHLGTIPRHKIFEFLFPNLL
jgi:hypothetical protein